MLFTGALAGDVADAVAYTANWTLLDGSLDDLGEYIISGLVQSAGTGLAVNVTSGVASIGGRVTKSVSFIIGSLTPSNTNHLYLNQDGTCTSNTTGTQPALSVKLGTATTDGSGVTGVGTSRAAGRQVRIRSENLVLGGGAGHPRSANLATWAAAAADGVEAYGSLPAGALPASVFLKDTNPQTLSDGVNIAVGSGSGTILATATSQKLGFWAATPVAQINGSTDVLAGLVTVGLRAASSNPPLNLGTGALTAGAATLGATSVTSLANSGNYGGNSTNALALKRFNKTFTADTDYTLGAGEADCAIIQIQTDAVLTTTRNIILPTTVGGFFLVFNKNAQAIGFKVSGGTQVISVASQRTAILFAPGGTDAFRVTPDTVYSV